ncbi:chromosomal replication initiator protein DnaA [Aerococcus urinae]|uniref:chromosomal replication initiator protein DnaA n=1 Tax=Aerococcus urinae TaxID=1376 RepID=UPI000DCF4403|nr:chromosomal replication initiator protein DnaA [Aerococcus urinae]
MDPLQELWQVVSEYFREHLTKGSFDTWILGLKPLRMDHDVLYIEAVSQLHKKHIESNYMMQLQQVIYDYLGREIRIEITLDNQQTGSNHLDFGQAVSPTSAPADSRPANRHSDLNPKYTFENFVVGEGNKMAHAAALAVAERPGRDYNPLFFYGGVGLGKTHLMQAIGHEVLRTHPDAIVKYVTSETFTNDFIEAIRTNTMPDFHQAYRHVDMLLVDDIQFIGNKQSTQEEFFHTFNALYNNNKHIVLTSDRDASQIPELEDRLVSRFKQGLSTDITPPDLETRIAILRNKAKVNGIDIPDETLSYIAGQIDTNIRELEGALTSVQAYAVMNQEELSPDVAARALSNYRDANTKKVPSIAEIQETVADYFDLTVADLKGKKRKRDIVVPRQIAMFLSREITDASLPKIGQEFGGKDHTTVLHAHEKISEAMKSATEIKENVESIQNLLKR